MAFEPGSAPFSSPWLLKLSPGHAALDRCTQEDAPELTVWGDQSSPEGQAALGFYPRHRGSMRYSRQWRLTGERLSPSTHPSLLEGKVSFKALGVVKAKEILVESN